MSLNGRTKIRIGEFKMPTQKAIQVHFLLFPNRVRLLKPLQSPLWLPSSKEQAWYGALNLWTWTPLPVTGEARECPPGGASNRPCLFVMGNRLFLSISSMTLSRLFREVFLSSFGKIHVFQLKRLACWWQLAGFRWSDHTVLYRHLQAA